MNNLSGIESELRDCFSTVKKVDDFSAFRCEKLYKETPIAVFYFDYSNKPQSEDSLRDYQDALLGKDYFKHAGALQWNYYLVFLVDKSIPAEICAKIEKDVKYTRKRVLPVQSLSSFLKVLPQEIPINNLPPVDVGARWRQKLDIAGLAGVYSNLPRSKVLDTYFKNAKAPAAVSKPAIRQVENVPQIPFIEQLVIDKFRDYPKQKNYTLGTANLFYGANGVGKTSLFEAIETFYCGGTLRNKKAPEKNIDLKIKYRGESSYAKAKQTNSYYQACDLHWYGKVVTRGNNLADSFNQYNFYNSDAAFLLAHEQSANQPSRIVEAFTSLALGEQANAIFERISLFGADFAAIKAKLTQQTRSLATKLAEAQERLKRAAVKSKQPEVVFSLLVEKLHELKWATLPANTLNDVEKISKQLNRHIPAIQVTVDKLHWAKVISWEEVDRAQKHLLAFTKAYLQLEQVRGEYRSAIDGFEYKINALERQASLLEKLRGYVEVGFDKLQARLKPFASIGTKKMEAEWLRSINLEILKKLEPSKDLSSNYEGFTKTLKSLEKEEQCIAEGVEILSANLSKLQQVVSRIKSAGVEYLQLNLNAELCPLCNSKLQKGELSKQIAGSIETVNVSGKQLIALQSEFGVLKGKRTETLNCLEVIKQLMSGLEMGKVEGCSVKNTVGELDLLLRKRVYEAECKDIEHSELLKEQAKLNRRGFTSESYTALIAEVMPFKETLTRDGAFNIERIEKGITTQKNNLDTLADKQVLIKRELENREVLLVEQLKTIQGGVRKPDAEYRIVQDQLAAIVSYKDVIGGLEKTVKVPLHADLRNILDQFKEAAELASKYGFLIEEEKRVNLEAIEAAKAISIITPELQAAKDRQSRCESGLKVLEDILTNDNKVEAVQSFVDENRKAIVEVFERIHAPREFEDIEPHGPSLRKIGRAESVPISQISTGQRAALAVSVFMALNSKLIAAPPIILIDDPVAHIDDLNILSFLDYLREISIAGKRQIFFATANRKLANLFEMKFSFLGEKEFKRFDLTRESQG